MASRQPTPGDDAAASVSGGSGSCGNAKLHDLLQRRGLLLKHVVLAAAVMLLYYAAATVAFSFIGDLFGTSVVFLAVLLPLAAAAIAGAYTRRRVRATDLKTTAAHHLRYEHAIRIVRTKEERVWVFTAIFWALNYSITFFSGIRITRDGVAPSIVLPSLQICLTILGLLVILAAYRAFVRSCVEARGASSNGYPSQ